MILFIGLTLNTTMPLLPLTPCVNCLDWVGEQ